MDDSDIKKANRKAMPKFMLILVISVLVGGTIGFCAAKYELNTLANDMKSAGTFFGIYCPLADVGGSGDRADDLHPDL